ncbi:MAG: hypothetical protein IJ085_07755 [Turicibacter sp.]|nr:hypothetical protein [Turicibacter sp.]
MTNDIQTQIIQTKETLKQYKQKGETIKDNRLTAQAQLNQLHLHEKEILEQCKSLGYKSVEELEQAISDKMKELNETLELLNRMLKGEVLTNEQVQQEKEVQEEIKPIIETPLVETSESSFFQSPFSKEEETTTSDFIFDFNSKPLESKEEEVGFDFNSLFNSEGV